MYSILRALYVVCIAYTYTYTTYVACDILSFTIEPLMVIAGSPIQFNFESNTNTVQIDSTSYFANYSYIWDNKFIPKKMLNSASTQNFKFGAYTLEVNYAYGIWTYVFIIHESSIEMDIAYHCVDDTGYGISREITILTPIELSTFIYIGGGNIRLRLGIKAYAKNYRDLFIRLKYNTTTHLIHFPDTITSASSIVATHISRNYIVYNTSGIRAYYVFRYYKTSSVTFHNDPCSIELLKSANDESIVLTDIIKLYSYLP